ncbi:hypothetical protein SS50377_21942 [Spironucleus salmonicida]|uniref:Uncharacterized protein n=1 Tax=Spironucleus salmonicida TaxID=348837 RepID=A0A9P8S0N7_9EUKA|nr:hypothetical protein SS50377_21942 [Spironucleus salmonicida]
MEEALLARISAQNEALEAQVAAQTLQLTALQHGRKGQAAAGVFRQNALLQAQNRELQDKVLAREAESHALRQQLHALQRGGAAVE